MWLLVARFALVLLGGCYGFAMVDAKAVARLLLGGVAMDVPIVVAWWLLWCC